MTRLRRLVLAFAGALLIGGVAATAVFFAKGGFFSQAFEAVFPEPTSYSAQVKELEGAQRTVNQLKSLLGDQERSLEERQVALNRLQAEHEALRKVLAIDQASAEAMFEQQRQQAQRDVWKERGFSFVLGILSGLLTALIVHWLKLRT